MNSAAAVPNRNAPCSCGSGRRYKHCCGAGAVRAPDAGLPEYAGWSSLSIDERRQLWQKMLDALAAQRSFRFDVAGPLYEQVLARAPQTFDAVHMLGAVRLMEGDYDAAESMFTRAHELAPDDEKVRHNLLVLAQRRAEHEGLYSLRSIVATDMLRLFGARRLVAPGGGARLFTADAGGARTHIVVPALPTMSGSNQTGFALARRIGAGATLWAAPQCDPQIAEFLSARRWPDSADPDAPSGRRLVLFGLSDNALAWLPGVAQSFEAIVIALDAHDPVVLVELLGKLEEQTLRRIHFVARSADVLEDLGLPGDVDPMLFDEQRPARAHPHGGRLRVGVFIPALRDHEDAERWRMLEWLRGRSLFLRVLYAGRLPSPHRASLDEHLVGLATQWSDWTDSLDALFYWGAEGHMRQYDRLVFDALEAGLSVIADGFGDFGAALDAVRDSTAFDGAGERLRMQFFDSAGARAAVAQLLEARAIAPVEEAA
jgi:hypothetical protein